jgi:flagellar biosynthesis/type III secretory pathway protein FliH
MSRTFSVMGDDLYFDGHLVATLAPLPWATLRDEVETFLNGLSCNVTDDEVVERERKEMEDEHAAELDKADQQRQDLEDERAKQISDMEDEHAKELQAAYEDGRAEGLDEGYDKGYAEGYAVGVRNTGEGK